MAILTYDIIQQYQIIMSNLLNPSRKLSFEQTNTSTNSYFFPKNQNLKKNRRFQSQKLQIQPNGKDVITNYVLQKNKQMIDQTKLSNQIKSINLCLVKKIAPSFERKSDIVKAQYNKLNHRRNYLQSAKIKKSFSIFQNENKNGEQPQKSFFMTNFDPSIHLNKKNMSYSEKDDTKFRGNLYKKSDKTQILEDCFFGRSNGNKRFLVYRQKKVKSSISSQQKQQQDQSNEVSPLKNKILHEKIGMQTEKSNGQYLKITVKKQMHAKSESQQELTMSVKKCVYHKAKKNLIQYKQNKDKKTEINSEYPYKLQQVISPNFQTLNQVYMDKEKDVRKTFVHLLQESDNQQEEVYLKTLS